MSEAATQAILIGRKPVMKYVLAVILQFSGGAKEVVLKARGRNISKAVDVAEVVRRKFMETVQVKDIKIGTETVEREGNVRNLSTVEIVLEKTE
ncbi:DNA-binding protein Alba [Candidatus Bathyarchaeota archaeon]|nr:MAG: DNA-binding protein Alba [Candidatus Bathyarchaeota archaeon]HDI42629.1 DNA-binding protein Alba [Candidatus Bathyarchaeota archaeon]